MRRLAPALLCALLLAAPVAAEDAAWTTRSKEVMATQILVRLPAGPDADRLAEGVFAVFEDVDRTMSEWKAGSPLAEVNRAAGQGPVAVPGELRALLRRGVELGERTEGAFDVSWAALWGLWDFKASTPRVPSDEQIASRTALIDYRALVIDDEAGTVALPKAGMKLGLGGIAKGWALDRSAAWLREQGAADFLLSAGGQVYAAGRPDPSRAWRVGIRDPRGPADDWFAMVDAQDASVSTSGDYERYFELDGVRYHHIIDPRTGRPARGVRSATVVAADATLADALSTALIVLGVEKGLALAEETPDVEAVLVDAQGGVHVTSGLADALKVAHPPKK